MKKVLAVIISVLLAASLVACGGNVATSGDGGQVTGTKGTDGTRQTDNYLIGISMPTKTAERWVIEGELMQKQLQDAGYQVDLQYANDEVPAQVSQIENMVTKGAKFLIVCPIDGEALSEPLSTAKAQGIQILAYDRLVMGTDNVDYFVGFDSQAIGNIMGESLMRGIGADTAQGPLYIELFAGSLDDSNTQYYFNGAVEKIQPYIDSGKVVVKSGQTALNECATDQWESLKAQSRMENLLSAHYTNDVLAGALSPYDGLSLGIIGALKAVGYGTADKPMPAVTGQDCEFPSLVSIYNGEQYSSVYLDLELLASRAVEVAKAMIEGKTISASLTYDNGVKEVTAYLADATELSKDNIKQVFIDSGIYTAEQLSQ